VFEEALVESLALADRSVLAGVFKSEAIAEGERLSPERVAAALRARGQESAVYADADAIVAGIAGELRSGDVVAILSNGGFGGIYSKLPEALEKLRGRWRRRGVRAGGLY
jgi:UDP-N-acetylmuramate: L-alanyl-gamma-D-glutamyl-meso-diaminopimelate ligase